MRSVRGPAIIGCLIAWGTAAWALDPAAQMRFADGLYSREMYELAVREYLVLVREAPGYEKRDTVYFRVAECYRQLGQYPAADAFYRRCLSEYPDSPLRDRAAYRRAELKVRDGNLLEAVNRLRAFLEDDPPADYAAPARYYLGYSLKRLQIRDDARKQLRAVLQDYPDSPFAAYAAIELADMLRSAEEPALAQAAALLDRAEELAPTPRVKAEALFQRAELAYAQSHFGDAAEAYLRLLDEFPGDFRAGEAGLQAAWSLIKAETRPVRAQALAEERLPDAAPEDRPAWLYLKANAHRLQEEWYSAAEAYDDLLSDAADHELAPAAAYEAALVATERGEHADVLERLDGVPVDPAVRADAHWLQAEAARALDRLQTARDHYRAIWRESAESTRAPAAGLRLARLLADGDPRAAADLYIEFAGRYPDHDQAPAALRRSASLYREAGALAAAADAWQTFLERYPEAEGRLEAGLQRALTLIRLEKPGQADRALEAIREEAAGAPLGAEILYWQGVLADQQGQTVKSTRLLREALDHDPAPDLAARIQYRLSAVLLRRGEREAAADIVQALVDSGRTEDMPPNLLAWLARNRLEKGAPASAERAAAALLANADEAAWTPIAGWLLGQSLQAQGRNEDAIEAYRQAVQAETPPTRETLEARLALGELLLARGQSEAAGRHIEAAVEAAADDEGSGLRARGLMLLARRHAAGDDLDAAARTWMSVAVLYDDPELSPEALYRAARAFDSLNRPERRQSALEELRSRYPESEWAARAQSGPSGEKDPTDS